MFGGSKPSGGKSGCGVWQIISDDRAKIIISRQDGANEDAPKIAVRCVMARRATAESQLTVVPQVALPADCDGKSATRARVSAKRASIWD